MKGPKRLSLLGRATAFRRYAVLPAGERVDLMAGGRLRLDPLVESRQRALHVGSVAHAGRLDEHDAALRGCLRSVSEATRHHEDLSGTHDCGRQPLEVDAKPATHHQEHLVHHMVVPYERALDLDELELPPVGRCDDLG